MDLSELGIGPRNWIDSAQNRDYWRAVEYPHLISGFHKSWSCSPTYIVPNHILLCQILASIWDRCPPGA
jgi:hypothetical protein